MMGVLIIYRHFISQRGNITNDHEGRREERGEPNIMRYVREVDDAARRYGTYR